MPAPSAGSDHVEVLLNIINKAARDALVEYQKLGEDVPLLSSTQAHPLDDAIDTINLKKAIRILEGACGQLCAMLAPPAHSIVNRVQTADRECYDIILVKNIPDILTQYPKGLPVDNIAAKVDLDKGKLSRILRLLATEHCFQEVAPNVFANNRLSVTLLRNNSVSSLTRVYTSKHSAYMQYLLKNLTHPDYAYSYESTKAPFMQAVGADGRETYFSWLTQHPEDRKIFDNAMLGTGFVQGSLSALYCYPWDNIKSVCDVGSGLGAFTMPLARKFPHLQIALLDLPDTMEKAQQLWKTNFAEFSLTPDINTNRISFITGDFLVELPESLKEVDVYYLRNVIHNWSDASALKILTNLRRIMAPQSCLLIHDYTLTFATPTPMILGSQALGLDKPPEPLLSNFGIGSLRAYNSDITMFGALNAKERTITELIDLGKQAGLTAIRFWDLGEMAMAEFKPTTNHDIL